MERYEEEGCFKNEYRKLFRAPHNDGEYIRITADGDFGSESAYFFIYMDFEQEDRMYVCINYTVCYLDEIEEEYFPVCKSCGSSSVEMREYNIWDAEKGWDVRDCIFHCLTCGSNDGVDFGDDNG